MKLVENYQTLPSDYSQNHIEQYFLNQYVAKEITTFMCVDEEPSFNENDNELRKYIIFQNILFDFHMMV
jgi:hypothetical protein